MHTFQNHPNAGPHQRTSALLPVSLYFMSVQFPKSFLSSLCYFGTASGHRYLLYFQSSLCFPFLFFFCFEKEKQLEDGYPFA